MEQLIAYAAGVVALGISAQWLAWRLRLPSILLLLAFGFLARLAAVWIGWPPPNELIGPEALLAGVSLSVAVILFEGGLSLRLREFRESGAAVTRFVTVGALVTWVLSAAAARWILGWDWPLAALGGAILVVTGPTVIIPLLRQIRPSGRVAAVAKWEGIVIDPIGAVLAVLVFEAVMELGHAEHSAPLLVEVATLALRTAVVGALVAVIAAAAVVQMLKRYWIPDYLHSVVFLATVLVSFTLSNRLAAESGLIAVTVLGVILANQRQVTVKHIVEFKENLRVLLISCLFIVLASQIKPGDIAQVGWRGAAFLAVLIAVVRPTCVFACTVGTNLTWRERTFLALLAPRGIVAASVASVFALKVGGDAEELAPLVFLVIVGTVAFYGLLAGPLARHLKLASAEPQGILFAGADRWVREMALAVQDAGFRVLLIDTNHRHVSAARMAGLPAVCASVLSEYVSEEVDLGGVGRLLAVTRSDEVNALAVREFMHVFGRAEVYQLPIQDAGAGRRESMSDHLRGRMLFGEGASFGHFASRFAGPSRVKKTKITEEFTFDCFRKEYGDSAIVLFVVSESGKLIVRTTDDDTTPKSGQTVIALVDD